MEDTNPFKIHGIVHSDSDSDTANKNDFDEEYNLLKPPPFNYDLMKNNIIKICEKPSLNNIWEERLKRLSEDGKNEQMKNADLLSVVKKKKKKRKKKTKKSPLTGQKDDTVSKFVGLFDVNTRKEIGQGLHRTSVHIQNFSDPYFGEYHKQLNKMEIETDMLKSENILWDISQSVIHKNIIEDTKKENERYQKINKIAVENNILQNKPSNKSEITTVSKEEINCISKNNKSVKKKFRKLSIDDNILVGFNFINDKEIQSHEIEVSNLNKNSIDVSMYEKDDETTKSVNLLFDTEIFNITEVACGITVNSEEIRNNPMNIHFDNFKCTDKTVGENTIPQKPLKKAGMVNVWEERLKCMSGKNEKNNEIQYSDKNSVDIFCLDQNTIDTDVLKRKTENTVIKGSVKKKRKKKVKKKTSVPETNDKVHAFDKTATTEKDISINYFQQKCNSAAKTMYSTSQTLKLNISETCFNQFTNDELGKIEKSLDKLKNSVWHRGFTEHNIQNELRWLKNKENDIYKIWYSKAKRDCELAYKNMLQKESGTENIPLNIIVSNVGIMNKSKKKNAINLCIEEKNSKQKNSSKHSTCIYSQDQKKFDVKQNKSIGISTDLKKENLATDKCKSISKYLSLNEINTRFTEGSVEIQKGYNKNHLEVDSPFDINKNYSRIKNQSKHVEGKDTAQRKLNNFEEINLRAFNCCNENSVGSRNIPSVKYCEHKVFAAHDDIFCLTNVNYEQLCASYNVCNKKLQETTDRICVADMVQKKSEICEKNKNFVSVKCNKQNKTERVEEQLKHLRNDINCFYYEFEGRNFKHFLEFREIYLYMPLTGNKCQQLYQSYKADNKTINQKEENIIKKDVVHQNLELCKENKTTSKCEHLRNDISCLYYEFEGRNFKHFLEFREIYLCMPLTGYKHQQLYQSYKADNKTINRKEENIIKEDVVHQNLELCQENKTTSKCNMQNHINKVELRQLDHLKNVFCVTNSNYEQLCPSYKLCNKKLKEKTCNIYEADNMVHRKSEIYEKNTNIVPVKCNKQNKTDRVGEQLKHLKNDVSCFYYEFEGENFKHFLEFREIYLCMPLTGYKCQKLYQSYKADNKTVNRKVENTIEEDKVYNNLELCKEKKGDAEINTSNDLTSNFSLFLKLIHLMLLFFLIHMIKIAINAIRVWIVENFKYGFLILILFLFINILKRYTIF